MEKDNFYYDKKYTNPKMTFRNRLTSYREMWMIILSWIDFGENIVDAGCGSGEFAKLAMDHGYNYRIGIDFSEEGIKRARELNPTISYQFFIRNLYYIDLGFIDFDVIVLLDILEHLDNDKKVIKTIPSGKKVIMALPTFPDESHVRVYKKQEEIQERYQEYLDFELFTRNKKRNIHLVLAWRK